MSDEEAVVDAVQTDAAPVGNAKIVLKRSGAETDITFPVNPPATIGRFDPAVGPIDVDLGDIDEGKYVSRKHAKIILDSGVYKLVDLQSSNGTFVLRSDFEKIDEAELTSGTEFALGNARFVFKIDAPEAPVADAEPATEPEPAAEPDPNDVIPPELA